MSFFCPHQDAKMESCQRLGGLKCRPGLAGCAMFGKVQLLEDVPPRKRTGRRKTATKEPFKGPEIRYSTDSDRGGI